jgi:hypothetical protein
MTSDVQSLAPHLRGAPVALPSGLPHAPARQIVDFESAVRACGTERTP